MNGFVKVAPGQACKVAEAFGTGWEWPDKNSTVQEAREADGSLVAYMDESGYYTHKSYATLDLSEIIA